MNKLVSLVAFLWLIIACEKSGEDNDPSTQTSTTQSTTTQTPTSPPITPLPLLNHHKTTSLMIGISI